MSRSPSYLAVVEGGCPAYAAAYRARVQGEPSDPLRLGSEFHRLAEAIQRGLDPEEAISQVGAGARMAEWVRRWAARWHGAPFLGAELAIAIDGEGAVVQWDRADLRGIVDRIEWGEGDGHIVVTDWKSGWSGWTGIQAECYGVLGAAWAAAQGLEVVRVTCRIWSPTAGGFREYREWSAESLPWELVWSHVEAAQRLEAMPVTMEVVGSGCRRCPLSGRCASFLGLALVEPVGIEEAARVYLAARAQVDALEARLRAHCEEAGVSVGGCGFRPQESITMDAVGVLSDYLLPFNVGPDVALALTKILSVSRTTAGKVAAKLRPRDRPGQAAWLETRVVSRQVKAVWSTSIEVVES